LYKISARNFYVINKSYKGKKIDAAQSYETGFMIFIIGIENKCLQWHLADAIVKTIYSAITKTI